MAIITPEWPAPPNVVAGTTTKQVPDGALPAELQFLNPVHGARVAPVDRKDPFAVGTLESNSHAVNRPL